MMTKSYKTKTKVSNGILFVVMLLLGICMIIPFVWTLSSSFKNFRLPHQMDSGGIPVVQLRGGMRAHSVRYILFKYFKTGGDRHRRPGDHLFPGSLFL